VRYSLTGILEGRHTIPVINKRVLSISKLYFFEPNHGFCEGPLGASSGKIHSEGVDKNGVFKIIRMVLKIILF